MALASVCGRDLVWPTTPIYFFLWLQLSLYLFDLIQGVNYERLMLPVSIWCVFLSIIIWWMFTVSYTWASWVHVQWMGTWWLRTTAHTDVNESNPYKLPAGRYFVFMPEAWVSMHSNVCISATDWWWNSLYGYMFLGNSSSFYTQLNMRDWWVTPIALSACISIK